GSRTAANSASHTPSANQPATRPTTSAASLVFPDPPGPVTVTSRRSFSRPATSATAPARPTKLVSAGANPCTPLPRHQPQTAPQRPRYPRPPLADSPDSPGTPTRAVPRQGTIPADPITEVAADQQQGREHQGVSVDDPLQVLR